MRVIGMVTESGARSVTDEKTGEKREFFNFSIEGLRLIVNDGDRDRVPPQGAEVNAVVRTGYSKATGRPFFILGQWSLAERYGG